MAADNPPNFPPNTLQVMRALCGIVDDQERLCAILERLFHEFWVNHVQIAQPDVFVPIFKEVLGAEVAEKGMCSLFVLSSASLHTYLARITRGHHSLTGSPLYPVV